MEIVHQEAKKEARGSKLPVNKNGAANIAGCGRGYKSSRKRGTRNRNNIATGKVEPLQVDKRSGFPHFTAKNVNLL